MKEVKIPPTIGAAMRFMTSDPAPVDQMIGTRYINVTSHRYEERHPHRSSQVTMQDKEQKVLNGRALSCDIVLADDPA